MLFRKLSILSMIDQEIESTQRDRLEATAHREYYAAIEDLLRQRLERLLNDRQNWIDAAAGMRE